MTREELLKIAKPILFNTEMVQAILEGRKTVTRRVLKLPNHVKQNGNGLYTLFADGACYENQSMEQIKEYIKPPFKAGDYLYVRETWCNWADDIGNNFFYKATDDGVDGFSPKWRPSIHMPKEAARIFLKVTDVRVERLQDMSEDDAFAEGVSPWDDRCYERNGWKPTFYDPDSGGSCQPLYAFEDIWNSTINKANIDKYGWEANPWVWVIEFERVEV